MAEAHESELNHDLEEETTLANEHSQHQESTYQNLEKERLFDVQPYSGLHIYANANASTDASANQGILWLMRQSQDYSNIASNWLDVETDSDMLNYKMEEAL